MFATRDTNLLPTTNLQGLTHRPISYPWLVLKRPRHALKRDSVTELKSSEAIVLTINHYRWLEHFGATMDSSLYSDGSVYVGLRALWFKLTMPVRCYKSEANQLDAGHLKGQRSYEIKCIYPPKGCGK